ncbi:unnamed protein product (macronuclear) [Paramecium tetraurelia]|uniref:Uncharacterized protein n=1 Tax=Paramecium tetraurelia TaxID=5888 RepID=A0C7A5_PARTE|nr:uncharacterized protein GSPATT00035802001 [Paramecium tetraurelia]CAK66672.1 unnamed protein product [Paramecium tetraurelia]|eukprot:XP_001434069.1 hypothetical protein (macronuclear) [Paramecium tetraurelia strain d4-2]
MLILLFILKIVIGQTVWENFYTAFVNDNMTEQESWVVTGAMIEDHIASCAGQQIIGGYAAFGSGTAVQKLFYLPPHYKLRINLNFWKLGCWDNEVQYIIIDDIVWQQTFSCAQGFSQCGKSYQDYLSQVEIITTHNSETLLILMKSGLDGWQDESWGFNNFTIDILKCIPDCLLCNQISSDICQPEMGIKFNQIYKPNVDGWFLTNNSPVQTTICLDNITLIGGYQKLGRSDLLKTKINLDPHYQVQIKFKIWLIDISSVSTTFNIVIDGISHPFTIIPARSISFCSSSQQESIYNVDFTYSHQNPELEIYIAPTSLSGSNPFWAIFNFNLYVFRCSSHCVKCPGPIKTQCEICSEEWFKDNGECNRIQNPIQITKLQLNQIFRSSMFLPIPISFEFLQIELSQYIGFFTRQQNNFQLDVQVQCNHNGLIQSKMNICHSCQSYQIYSQTFQCQESIKKFIKLSIQLQKQNITSEEQYLISTNNTYFLLQQIYYNREIKVGNIVEISLLYN